MHLNISSLLYRFDKFTELLDHDLIISFKISVTIANQSLFQRSFIYVYATYLL